MMHDLIRRTLRGLGEHPYVSVVSTAVITTSLMLVGAWALVTLQIEVILGAWQQDAHVSLWLKQDSTPEARAALVDRVKARPEVTEVTYVTEVEASTWLRAHMPELGPALDDLGETALPASVEVVLGADYATTETASSFAAELQADPSVTSVDHAADWVARAQAFLGLFRTIGIVFGVVVAAAALFLVANTVHLGVYARRDEVEIMRLVGATDSYIIAPFAAEGALQGAAGSVTAMLLLGGISHLLTRQAGEVFAAVMGQAELPFLPGVWLAGLTLLGISVGAVAHAISVYRFLGRVP